MQLTEYLNSHPNWEEELTKEPYNLKVKHENGYIIIKYWLNTDFSYEICKEARGVIFKSTPDGYVCVCHPFDKFFNYEEVHADNIDWNTATVYEKVDGSLIKVWFDETWHVSTNGCVDAFEAEANETKISFGQLFNKAVNFSLFDELDKTHTYMFELVSPQSQLVVEYSETAAYYIGERDKTTDKELYNYTDIMASYGVKKPLVYQLHKLNDVIALVNSFDVSHEGCVVRDASFKRIKIKGAAYLSVFFMRCQSNVSDKRIIDAIKNETIDDWAAYNPDVAKRYDKMISTLKNLATEYEQAYENVTKNTFFDKKELAEHLQKYYNKYMNYIYCRLNRPELTGFDYILKQSRKTILSLLRGAKDV